MITHDDPFERSGSPTEIVSCDALPLREQRFIMFQLLYAYDASEPQRLLDEVVEQFCRGFYCTIRFDGLIYRRVTAVVGASEELDAVIKPLLHNWRFERLSTASKLILRLALWELQYTDLDPSVIINEAVELAKAFAEHDAHKFVNGLLDEWIRQFRPDAIKPEVPAQEKEEQETV